MKNGSPPTEANDRTGEETPPGMRFRARRKSAAERLPATLDFGLATLYSSERQRTIRQPFRGLARVVRQNEVRAGAEDPGQDLTDDPLLVHPAVLCGGLHHRVLARHVERGDRRVETLAGVSDHVEVGERGLDHDRVRSFREIERDLSHRLTAV